MQNMCLSGKQAMKQLNKHHTIGLDMQEHKLLLMSEWTMNTQATTDDTEGGINYDE
ncbi:MAG: hypothetical protein J07HQW1_01901 [Haloquadratum walsbyi J07HQW1]|jgi:hypothetical protein|uniref:Uncharacterized protein n=1 Tax=Haloquadratum walsbyi J07HQW1 TaxID=1238424 RepID=U1PE42_9EURY|nr:MAG: hypothetical protein J07HQW1_01901 [Haloquadratum walsbyi J07HQW1]